MIGLGIAWASMTGVPSLMVVTMVPARRIGVYLGILNMMVVVPMLIQTVTFGWIFEHLLGGKGTNAIMLAGVLLGCGAISMLWVNSPRPDEESPIVPLGAPRHFATVYDEVIVGSDGTPTSLVAVGHAAGVAHAADAHLVVVTAYDPNEKPTGLVEEGGRELLYGEEKAEAAMEASVRELTVGKRVRRSSGGSSRPHRRGPCWMRPGTTRRTSSSWATAAWVPRRVRCSGRSPARS